MGLPNEYELSREVKGVHNAILYECHVVIIDPRPEESIRQPQDIWTLRYVKLAFVNR